MQKRFSKDLMQIDRLKYDVILDKTALNAAVSFISKKGKSSSLLESYIHVFDHINFSIFHKNIHLRRKNNFSIANILYAFN